MKRCASLAVWMGAIPGWAIPALADRLELLPATADSCLSATLPDVPGGGDYDIEVTEGYYKGRMNTERGLLRFQIEAAVELIAEATLQLNFHGMSSSPEDITEAELSLHFLTRLWEEEYATWRQRLGGSHPTYWDSYLQSLPIYEPGGGDFDPQPALVFTLREEDTWQPFTLDVTAIVRAWQSGAIANHGLLLRFHDETAAPGDGTQYRNVDFVSRDHPHFLEDRPTLILRLHLPGDLNDDNVVDQQDLGILLAAYELNDAGDINGDGLTDQQDLGILLANYDRTLL